MSLIGMTSGWVTRLHGRLHRIFSLNERDLVKCGGKAGCPRLPSGFPTWHCGTRMCSFLPLCSRMFTLTTNDFTRRRQSSSGFLLLTCTVVVLFLGSLPIYGDGPLGAIIDIEHAKRRASDKKAALALEMENMEREREMMTRERELWDKAKDD